MLHLSPRQDALSVCQCPDGEIGKRCGLRSRWSKILESSSLSSGTLFALNRLTINMLDGFLFFGVGKRLYSLLIEVERSLADYWLISIKFKPKRSNVDLMVLPSYDGSLVGVIVKSTFVPLGR